MPSNCLKVLPCFFGHKADCYSRVLTFEILRTFAIFIWFAMIRRSRVERIIRSVNVLLACILKVRSCQNMPQKKKISNFFRKEKFSVDAQ